MTDNVILNRSVIANGIKFEYILIKTGTEHGARYSIEIIEQNRASIKSCRLNDISRNEEKALCLFRLLSENTVCPTSAQYIIDDLADSITFC